MLIVFVTLLSGQAFWYLENKVYCNLENKNVTIFMKNEEWTVKCQTYLDTIYQLALKKYNEISAIRSYIEQGDDGCTNGNTIIELHQELCHISGETTRLGHTLSQIIAVEKKQLQLLLIGQRKGVAESPEQEHRYAKQDCQQPRTIFMR